MIKALIAIVNRVIGIDQEEHAIHLLKALPLLHLLRGDCKPRQQIVIRPSTIEWTDTDIKLGSIKRRIEWMKIGYELCFPSLFICSYHLYH